MLGEGKEGGGKKNSRVKKKVEHMSFLLLCLYTVTQK